MWHTDLRKISGFVFEKVATLNLYYSLGFTPLREGDTTVMKTSVGDVLRRLLQPKSMMSSAIMEKGIDHCMLSALAILQGRIDPTEIYSSLAKIKERRDIK